MTYWMVQYKIRGGWANRHDTIEFTRHHAIKSWEKEMNRSFRKERRRGTVRCIKVKIMPVEEEEGVDVGSNIDEIADLDD